MSPTSVSYLRWLKASDRLAIPDRILLIQVELNRAGLPLQTEEGEFTGRHDLTRIRPAINFQINFFPSSRQIFSLIAA